MSLPGCYRNYSIMANTPCSTCGVALKCALYTKVGPFRVMHAVRFTDIDAAKNVDSITLPSGREDGVTAFFELMKENALFADAKQRKVYTAGGHRLLGLVASAPADAVKIDLRVPLKAFDDCCTRRVRLVNILDPRSKTESRLIGYPADLIPLVREASKFYCQRLKASNL
jgi:hypothetical protein